MRCLFVVFRLIIECPIVAWPMKNIILVFLAVISTSVLAHAGTTMNLSQSQNPDALWRLYPTKNIFTFIELNTQNGSMFQLQWGFKGSYRYEVPICGGCNQSKEAPNARPGRFTLYPTQNIYEFILLDQVTGDTWQVQWDSKGGMVVPILVVPDSALQSSSAK